MKKFIKTVITYFMVIGNVIREWRKNWGSLLVLIIPVLITFQNISDYLHKYIWLDFIVIGILLIGWIHSNKNIQDYSELKDQLLWTEFQNENLRENLESIPTIIVKHIFYKIGLNSKDRITIYRYDNDEFINIGRFSSNVEFAKKGRPSYPKDKGFIGECWANDFVYIEKLPVYENNPEKYVDKISKKANIEKNVLREMTMKSRCYYCRKIFDTKKNAFAVIVVETINNSLGEKKEQIDKIIDNDQFGALLLESIEFNLPIGKRKADNSG